MGLTGLSQTLHQEYLQWINTMSMDCFEELQDCDIKPDVSKSEIESALKRT